MQDLIEFPGCLAVGHIKIYEPNTGLILVNKKNAIHYENLSTSLASCLSNQGNGWIAEMSFGNGGTRTSPTGVITYLTPNTVGISANLYNQTYYKTVDGKSAANTDPTNNFLEIRHQIGKVYTDILIHCLLDFGEPSGQDAFDTAGATGDFVFDELGLRAFSNSGPNSGILLTHVIFHPVQKSLNRQIAIDYTVRLQTLTTITG